VRQYQHNKKTNQKTKKSLAICDLLQKRPTSAMKRVQDDEKKTDSGGRSPCALRHHNEAPTKKKARLSPNENDATAAPLNAHGAAWTLVLSDLPDLVLHHLVRFVHPPFVFVFFSSN
jgi:hypothetical protein